MMFYLLTILSVVARVIATITELILTVIPCIISGFYTLWGGVVLVESELNYLAALSPMVAHQSYREQQLKYYYEQL